MSDFGDFSDEPTLRRSVRRIFLNQTTSKPDSTELQTIHTVNTVIDIIPSDSPEQVGPSSQTDMDNCPTLRRIVPAIQSAK